MDMYNPCAKAHILPCPGRTLTTGEKWQLGSFGSLAGKDEAGKTDTESESTIGWGHLYGKAI